MDQEALRKALNLGKAVQIGCVVKDLATTIKNYEEVLGIGPFMTVTAKPEKTFVKGRRVDNAPTSLASAQLTPELSLELIPVTAGEIYQEFYEKHGEGLQHIGFMTDDYDGVLQRAEKLDIPVLFSVEASVEGVGHVRGTYFDTRPLTGVIFELIEIKP
jgi:catechol 2,3-dioxygenase-like lactoylglutathione lyase family enzyme